MSQAQGRREKILIVRMGALGDILHTIPAQQFLARTKPSPEIHWVVKLHYVELLEQVPRIDRIWTVGTGGWCGKPWKPKHFFSLVRSLRLEMFNRVIDFQGLVKSALLARLAGGRRTSGFSGERVRESLATLLYTDPVRVAPGQRHQVEYNLDLVAPPRCERPSSPCLPVEPTAAASDYVRGKLRQLGISKPILLNPGGGWKTKRWPIERFSHLADRIESELGLPTLFTCGPGEEYLAYDAGDQLKQAPLRFFSTTVIELAALCRQARLMVAGDTGPMHLAVGMGTPVVAILGPAFPWRTGPYNRRDQIVQHPLGCPNPYRRKCDDHFCMDIGVEDVLQKVVMRLEDDSHPAVTLSGAQERKA